MAGCLKLTLNKREVVFESLQKSKGGSMIVNFKDRESEKVYNYNYEFSKSLQSIARTARRKLGILNAATSLTDLKAPPNNRLEALKGNREGQYSIRISEKWRICFVWHDKNAYDVEITDYH